MTDSARDFERVVWPAISHWCGDGLLVSCETDRQSITGGLVDRYAGIDYWQVQDEQGRMRGIASRVQYGPRCWSSFTIRSHRRTGAKTELEKRSLAIQQGWLIPALTVQAYVSARGGQGELVGAGVGLVYTRDLYRYVADHGVDGTRPNPQDGNLFGVVWWHKLRAAGYRVRTLEDDSRVAA